MKTTLIIDDGLMRSLKARAASLGDSLSGLVEKLLRAGLRAHDENKRADRVAERLPAFDMGPPKVDIADREAIDRAVGESPLRGYEAPPAIKATKKKVRARR